MTEQIALSFLFFFPSTASLEKSDPVFLKRGTIVILGRMILP